MIRYSWLVAAVTLVLLNGCIDNDELSEVRRANDQIGGGLGTEGADLNGDRVISPAELTRDVKEINVAGTKVRVRDEAGRPLWE